MKYENYFKGIFESNPDYRKIVLLIFLIQNDNRFLQECGFLESDINRLCLQLKTILIEQNEEFLDYTKNEQESIIERFFKK